MCVESRYRKVDNFGNFMYEPLYSRNMSYLPLKIAQLKAVSANRCKSVSVSPFTDKMAPYMPRSAASNHLDNRHHYGLYRFDKMCLKFCKTIEHQDMCKKSYE